MKQTHPTRLGMALSRAVWTYEMENNVDKAYVIAQTSLHDAM